LACGIFPRNQPNQSNMKSAFILAVTSLAILQLSAAPADWSKLPPAAKTEGVTFAKDIQPLFKASCVGCHGAERPKAQLRLDTLEGVLKGTKQGSILKTGDSANSLLVKAVSQLDSETAMPPKPRNRRNQGGPGGGFDHAAGTNAPAMQSREGGPGGPDGGHGPGERPPGGPQGTNAPGQRPRNFGPPAKPLTAEQVGLVRAWIDQGAK
jgi:mono/diheme cytochrome c family protein